MYIATIILLVLVLICCGLILARLGQVGQNGPLLVSQIQTALEKQSGENRDQLSVRLTQTFEALRQSLEVQLSTNRKEMGDSIGRIEARVNDRLDVIGKNVQTKLDTNIQEGFKHFKLVTDSLANAEKQLANLSQVGSSVNELNALLKLPHLRGGFGEATLERLLSDFLPAGTYELQHKISPDSPERVDAVVLFPDVKLPIDSKFSRETILPLFESSSDPQAMAAARKALSDTIKAQAKSIADKYIKPEHGTTELALIFLPSETLYFEVIRDTALWESLAKLKVFPVSPNTLSISLQFIGRSMHYYEAAQNVKKLIGDLGKARKHFENFHKKFDDIGRGLEKAQDAFSVATRHLGTYKGSVNRLSGEVTTEELSSATGTLPDETRAGGSNASGEDLGSHLL